MDAQTHSPGSLVRARDRDCRDADKAAPDFAATPRYWVEHGEYRTRRLVLEAPDALEAEPSEVPHVAIGSLSEP